MESEGVASQSLQTRPLDQEILDIYESVKSNREEGSFVREPASIFTTKV